MSETTSEKALRLIAEGRVTVTSVTGWPDGMQYEGTVVGDTGEIYAVYVRGNAHRCTCAAYGPNCSHLKALRLVTTHEDLEAPAADTMPPTIPMFEEASGG